MSPKPIRSKSLKITPHADVLSENLEGEEVLLHLGTKTYFGLNRTGTLVWQLVCKGKDCMEIAEKISETHDIPPDDACRDVKELLHELQKYQLVTLG